MKLKYYLRGLATGIVVTTLILTIANAGNKPLSDAQIRQRAAQLGMVESDSLKLSALQSSESADPVLPSKQTEALDAETSKSDETTSTETASSEVAVSSESTGTEASKASETPSSEVAASSESTSTEASKVGETPSSEVAVSSESTGAEASKASETPSSETASTPSSAEVESGDGSAPVVIVIYSGATSYTVSKDLAAAGLVEDAKEYDTYLCDNGLASKIHVGTYEILPGTGWEEIARMIAY